MTKGELENEYFEWLYRFVSPRLKTVSYRKLLRYLHSVPFIFSIDTDENRAADGIDLRYRFGDEQGRDMPAVSSYLDDRQCSVAEMMIALAIRCEEHIMDDPDIGNRTCQWFLGMLKSLGLYSMNDRRFDIDFTERAVSKFLNREYGRNGNGGLFTVKNCRRDLRAAEIWYQMCWYLDEVILNAV